MKTVFYLCKLVGSSSHCFENYIFLQFRILLNLLLLIQLVSTFQNFVALTSSVFFVRVYLYLKTDRQADRQMITKHSD